MKKHISTAGITIFLLFCLAGCGAAQATKDGAIDAMKWAFTTQIKTMNIDLVARAAVNPDRRGRSLSTVVRIYQLKSASNFEKLDYAQLQGADVTELKQDLLASKGIVIGPGTSASIVEPMQADTEYVGIAAFFRDPDGVGQWRLVLPKSQWKKASPVRVELRGSSLYLLSLGSN